nr:glycosyltransferase [Georgenia soli]
MPDPDALPIALLAARVTGSSVVFDIHEEFHGGLLQRLFGKRLGSLTAPLVKWAISALAGRADIVTAVSRTILDMYSGTHAARQVVHNAPPAAFARGERGKRIADGAPMRIFHGKALATNGTPQILDAAAKLRGRDAQFVMIPYGMPGGPAFWPDFEDALSSRDAEANVALAEPVQHSRIPGLLQSCDVGIIAYGRTLGESSLPNRFFEYIAAGLPVIVPSYATEMASIVKDHRIGLTVDAEDPESIAGGIVWMLENREEAMKMGERARELFVDRYSWEPTFARLRRFMSETRAGR